MATQQKKTTRKAETSGARANGHQQVKFHVQAPPKSKVFVAGTFNEWDPSANRLRQNGNSTYAANIMLTPGRHEYKFVVNGEWQIDCENSEWAPNDMGSLNSVMEVADKTSSLVAARA